MGTSTDFSDSHLMENLLAFGFWSFGEKTKFNNSRSTDVKGDGNGVLHILREKLPFDSKHTHSEINYKT